MPPPFPLAELGTKLEDLQNQERAVDERIQRSKQRWELEKAEIVDIQHTQNNLRAAIRSFVNELEELTEATGG